MIGLVLEGGANRTYYSVGALDALLDLKIEVDFLVGVSAGIANGVSYISKQHGRSLELGLNYASDRRYMGMRYFFKKNNYSYYNIDFVFRQIPDKYLPFDYDTFSGFKGDVYAVVTNVSTGMSEYMKVDDYAKSWKVILASCSLPLMFKPVELGGQLYMDGGCSDPLPVKFAFESGCDRVITVLTREREYSKEKNSENRLSSAFFGKNKEFAAVLKNRNNIYNSSKKYIFQKEDEGQAFVLAPKDTTGWKRTEKSPDVIKKMYDEGYRDVMDRADELKAFVKNNGVM